MPPCGSCVIPQQATSTGQGPELVKVCVIFKPARSGRRWISMVLHIFVKDFDRAAEDQPIALFRCDQAMIV